MNKVELKFAISNLKKTIYYAECANKFSPKAVREEIIEELKVELILHQAKLREIE
jgi:hypothetical protein